MEDQYNAQIKKWGKVERKGKNIPYTSHNGHMFTFLDTKNGYMALRLEKKDHEHFMEKYKTGPVIQYGSTMRGYVEVPKIMFDDFKLLKPWLEKSFDYICTLKPKPSNKKK